MWKGIRKNIKKIMSLYKDVQTVMATIEGHDTECCNQAMALSWKLSFRLVSLSQ